MNYGEVQSIAKHTLCFIKNMIKPGMKLREVRMLCEEKMMELGADSFWYWEVGAFVFLGDETTVSVSGRDYKTSDRKILENDIITIDLSPQCDHIWGDYARTIIIENGKVADDIASIQNTEWKKGLQMEQDLHQHLFQFVNESVTFEDLYYHMNDIIVSEGFVNLDFLGNLGHSIEKKQEDRVYIEKGNRKKLSEVSYFTFEPHIARKGSVYGYKWENIYYLVDGKLREL